MAHLESYTRKQIGKISRETYREHEREEAYKNNVDLSKSHLNYSMRGLDRNEFLNRIDKRCLEVMQDRKMQSQTKVVGSWVFTCPDELRGDPIAEQKYFETAMAFCEARYGSENVIDGVVHYDETSPHMTVYTVPVGKSRKTGLETVSKASVFTRTDLQQFHTDFEQVLQVAFGRTGLGLNGRTKGGYTLEELKERTEQEAKLEAREKSVQTRERELEVLDKELSEKETRLTEKEQALISKENEIRSKESNFALREQNIVSRENSVLKAEKSLKDEISALQDYPELESRLFRKKVKQVQPAFHDKVLKSVRDTMKNFEKNVDIDLRSETETEREKVL